MEKQYIGARYVPKFADPVEWNSETTYEALTIVTYLGASYTSKKAVPAGVIPTNTEYWVVTGNYNAQVEEYRQEVNNITTDYNKRFNRKWLFLGDSYDVHGQWVSKLATMLGLKSNEYWNLAVSGHGFNGNNWLNDITAWVDANPREVENIGVIVIGGGLNDSNKSTYDVIDTLMSDFAGYCNTTFNDATIKLAYFGWEIDTVGSHSSTAAYRAAMQWRYSLCTRYGMEYLSGCECAIHNRMFVKDDGFHPNASGGNAIAIAMCNAIRTGCGAVSFPVNTAVFTPVSGEAETRIEQTITNNNVFTYFNFRLTNAGITFQGGQTVKVGDLAFPLSNPLDAIDTMLYCKRNDNVYVWAPFRIIFTGDAVSLLYRGFDTAGTGYGSITPERIDIYFTSDTSALTH